jgi:isopenicillin N synthase-like dioxygenase
VSVPVIDISGKTRRVVEQIGRACTEIGFLTVVGHGVDERLVEETAAAARAFFDLPEGWFEEAFREHSRLRRRDAPAALRPRDRAGARPGEGCPRAARLMRVDDDRQAH